METKTTNVLSLSFEALQYSRWPLFSLVLCQKKGCENNWVGVTGRSSDRHCCIVCLKRNYADTKTSYWELHFLKADGKETDLWDVTNFFLPRKNLKTFRSSFCLQKFARYNLKKKGVFLIGTFCSILLKWNKICTPSVKTIFLFYCFKCCQLVLTWLGHHQVCL